MSRARTGAYSRGAPGANVVSGTPAARSRSDARRIGSGEGIGVLACGIEQGAAGVEHVERRQAAQSVARAWPRDTLRAPTGSNWSRMNTAWRCAASAVGEGGLHVLADGGPRVAQAWPPVRVHGAESRRSRRASAARTGWEWASRGPPSTRLGRLGMTSRLRRREQIGQERLLADERRVGLRRALLRPRASGSPAATGAPPARTASRSGRGGGTVSESVSVDRGAERRAQARGSARPARWRCRASWR